MTTTISTSPFSVTGTISVSSGPALYGPGGGSNSWTVINSGLISSTDPAAAGIQLGSLLTNVQSGVVTNKAAGTISGGAYGVSLSGAGAVTNRSGGYISATSYTNKYSAAVYLFDFSAAANQLMIDVVNQGTLTGPSGVYERSAGSLTNTASGTITGTSTSTSAAGVRLGSSFDTAINGGLVSGSHFGFWGYEGGNITNLASGTITGATGVYFGSNGNPISFSGTLDNAGTVIGSQYAVDFAATGGSYRLIAEPGAVFQGAIQGGGNALELASGGSTGSLSGFGSTITNFSTLQFDQGARWEVSGNATGLGTIGTITGFAGGDTIDLTDFTATGATATFASNTLTLTNASAQSATLNVAGTFTSADFRIAPDGADGSDITVQPRTFTWIGSNGNWNIPSNWDLGSVPSSVDSALINPSATNTVTVNDSETVANVTLDGPNDTLAVGILGTPGGFLGATGSITIDAGTFSDIGGFTAAQVTDDGVLNVITNGTQTLSTPLSLGGTLQVVSAFSQPGTLALGSGEVVAQSGASAVIGGSDNPADAVVNQGSIAAGFAGGTMTIDPAHFINQGKITVSNHDTLDVSSPVGSGSGTIAIGGSAIADFTASVDHTQTLAFTDATGMLKLAQPSGFQAPITNFGIGNSIDLTSITANAAHWASNALTVTSGGTVVATLAMPGNLSSDTFHVAPDGGTGSVVTATCYAAGTRILTPTGEVPIERLHQGDLVLTISRKPQPIRWIGYRRVNLRHHPNRERILPVRIAAHAFGPGRPKRNLLLSPDHAVFVDDVLIPIRHLINGGNVTRVERHAITYYHIELPRHDVLLAEGMPAESYLEAGARNAFGNGDMVIQLHPDFTPPQDHYATLWELYGYAPLVVTGETLERVRNLLDGNRYAA